MTRSWSDPRADAPAGDVGRGRLYPWIFVAGFLAVIAVNATMATIAVRSFSGIETPRPYAQGVAYNQVLAASRDQAALGWQIEARHIPLAAAAAQDRRVVELLLSARDAAGRPLDDLAVRALAIRPTRADVDRELALAWTGQGSYRAVLELPLPGQWDLRLLADRGDAHWQSVTRLRLP